MHKRMLDKMNRPSIEEFRSFIGSREDMFENLDDFMGEVQNIQRELRFPYGNHYGWGIKYSVRKKHICDIFAEKDAFTVMMRLSNDQFEGLYSGLSAYTREYIDNKYPCGSGGWIHYRVLEPEHLEDVKKMLGVKLHA